MVMGERSFNPACQVSAKTDTRVSAVMSPADWIRERSRRASFRDRSAAALDLAHRSIAKEQARRLVRAAEGCGGKVHQAIAGYWFESNRGSKLQVTGLAVWQMGSHPTLYPAKSFIWFLDGFVRHSGWPARCGPGPQRGVLADRTRMRMPSQAARTRPLACAPPTPPAARRRLLAGGVSRFPRHLSDDCHGGVLCHDRRSSMRIVEID